MPSSMHTLWCVQWYCALQHGTLFGVSSGTGPSSMACSLVCPVVLCPLACTPFGVSSGTVPSSMAHPLVFPVVLCPPAWHTLWCVQWYCALLLGTCILQLYIANIPRNYMALKIITVCEVYCRAYTGLNTTGQMARQ